MFTDERWRALGLTRRALHRLLRRAALRPAARRARRLHGRRARRRRARAARLRPLAHSRATGHRPVGQAFEREFRAFRARYPWVRDYLTWNEANHCSQPTCQQPGARGPLLPDACAALPGCRIVAADVLDGSKLVRWVRRSSRRSASAGDLGPAQLHRRQPLPHARHEGAAARRSRATSGSPRPAGSSGARTTARRSSSRSRRATRRRRPTACSSSPRSPARQARVLLSLVAGAEPDADLGLRAGRLARPAASRLRASSTHGSPSTASPPVALAVARARGLRREQGRGHLRRRQGDRPDASRSTR